MRPNFAFRINEDIPPYSTPFLEEGAPYKTSAFPALSRNSLRGTQFLPALFGSLLIHLAFLAILTLFRTPLLAPQGPMPVMVRLVSGADLGSSSGGENGTDARKGPGNAHGETLTARASEGDSHSDEGPPEPMQEDISMSPPPLQATPATETSSVPEPIEHEIERTPEPEAAPAKLETAVPKPKQKPLCKPKQKPRPLSPPASQDSHRAGVTETSHGKRESAIGQTDGKTGESSTAREGPISGQEGAADEEGSPGGERGSGPRNGPGHGAAGRDAPAGEFLLNQVEKPPRILRRVEPSYPIAARSKRLAGKVMVKVLVDSEGEVTKPIILEATPQGVFESCVLDAVRQWRFKPGYHKGKAVATWVVLPIQFRLTD